MFLHRAAPRRDGEAPDGRGRVGLHLSGTDYFYEIPAATWADKSRYNACLHHGKRKRTIVAPRPRAERRGRLNHFYFPCRMYSGLLPSESVERRSIATADLVRS